LAQEEPGFTIEAEYLTFEEIMALTSSVASKSEEGVADAPSSVIVFTHKEIETMGISSLEELLNFVPGFQTTRDIEQGTANRISARGRSSALSESVLFLLNGQRLNDLYTGGVSLLNRMIPVENIKQVEIIRGPGSALYGSNAFLGVVDIRTFDDLNSFDVKFGTENVREASANFAHEYGDVKIAGFLKAFSEEGFEYNNVTDIFGNEGETTDPAKGMDAYFTMNYKSLTLHARHMDRTLNDFLTFGALANNVNSEKTKQSSFDAKFSTEVSEDVRLEFASGYSQDQWLTQALLIPAGIEIAPGFALSENFVGGPFLESYNFNLNVDGFFKVSKTNQLIAGASFEKSAISSVKNLMNHHPIELEPQGRVVEFADASTTFNREESRNIVGLYLQDKQTIGESISLTAGVRFDNYNDFGSSFNPRFAFIYSTPFDSKIKFMYGNAFRAPNFLELYDKNNPVDFGNPDLKAETVQTIEVAYAQSFSAFQGTVTYFNNNIKDQILLDAPVDSPDNPLGSATFTNGADLKTNGLEFDFRFSPAENILLAATFTHLMDADLLLMPANFASFALNVNLSPININVNGIYRDQIAIMASQDAYFILNTALSYNFSSHVKAQFIVKNIFDEEYHTISLVFPDGVINKGRSIKLGFIFDM